MWLSTSFYIPTPVVFHPLGPGSTEKGGCPTGGSLEIRDGGTELGGWRDWRRWKWQSQVQRQRVSMGLLRGAMLHSSISPAPPPHKKVHHTPSATISHPPPQESTGPDVPEPADQVMKAVSPAAPSASEGGHPCPYAAPWHSAGGHQMSIPVPC